MWGSLSCGIYSSAVQVRSEKALLEKQEQMLKLREEQLIQERRKQERLREEAQILRRQEEEIRRRQEEIAAELMASDMKVQGGVEEVMVCQAREGQVYVGRKPHFTETVLDGSLVHVQTLGASDWDSTSEAESIKPGPDQPQPQPQPQPPQPQGVLKKSVSRTLSNVSNSYRGANENYDSSSPFVTVSDKVEIIEPEELVLEDGEDWTGSSEEEDTMEEELYECKVEVKTRDTTVPVSVRTIESVVDVPGWAQITPYLNVSKSLPATSAEEVKIFQNIQKYSEIFPSQVSAIFSEGKQSMHYITAGVITSPESVMSSTNMITTPDSSVSLQSQLSTAEDHEFSSWPGSPAPPSLPPPPRDSKDLMKDSFQTVQPDVPPRDDSYAVTAVYSKDDGRKPDRPEACSHRRSLIEVENQLAVPQTTPALPPSDPQLSPRIGGPGSAFKPYASTENLLDPTVFAAGQKQPQPGGVSSLPLPNGHNQLAPPERNKRFSASSLKPPKIVESEEEFFKPKPSPKSQRSSRIFSTTDTEPEMKEFNLAPIGSDKKSKKFQKPIYSTSETEEEYQNYLKMKPRWHGKGGHKDSWDPLLIASPPQIVQKPVGVVQKPKPQPQQISGKVERGTEVYPVSLQIYPGNGTNGHNGNGGGGSVFDPLASGLVPPNWERIQKSDSIIEMREKGQIIPAFERIQKSNSVVEVVPVRKLTAPIQHSLEEANSYEAPSAFKPTLEGSAFRPAEPAAKELSPSLTTNTVPTTTFSNNLSSPERDRTVQPGHISSSFSSDCLQGKCFSPGFVVAVLRLTCPILVPISPQDSEDQSTPVATRKLYSSLPKQTSIESTNSFSENDETTVLKAIKEDPETTKKKEIHKNLMNEALKKVEMRNNQKKNFSQLARTNPTLAALNIVTRKELKMEELQERQEQEDQIRTRHKSGSLTQDQEDPVGAPSSSSFPSGQNNSSVNSGVLQTFRELSIHKGPQNSASRQAAIAAKKASTPVKPELGGTKSGSISKELPAVSSSTSDLVTTAASQDTPVVVLRKQPRILQPEELKARTSGRTGASSPRTVSPSIDAPLVVQETPREHREASETVNPTPTTPITTITSTASTTTKTTAGKPGKTLSSPGKESRAEAAIEKVKAAKQKVEAQKGSPAVKQKLEGLVHVTPKQEANLPAVSEPERKTSVSGKEESQPAGTKLVRRAAEKFEANLTELNNKDFSSSVAFSSNIRGRSKSISSKLREQMVESEGRGQEVNTGHKTVLPWTGKSPPVRRREGLRTNKGFALQMSKSSDSITAAKLLAQARAESSANSLRINSNFSKSIQQQLDVYSKTKDEIRQILDLAKVGSVTDRINLFSNMMEPQPRPTGDNNQKAEAIRREIEEARAAEAGLTVSDTEIEFQAPIESKVKPLKIPMKPKILNNPGQAGGGLRINQTKTESPKKDRRPSIEDLPCVKSKIQTYISALSEESGPPPDDPTPQSQMTPRPILRKTSSSLEPATTLTPILKRRESQLKERSRSPKKKTPRLVSDSHLLSAEQSLKIYTLSATDVSATEDEGEPGKRERQVRGRAEQAELEPGPTRLTIPAKLSSSEGRPGGERGLSRSKSAAEPGQFECSVEEAAGRKIQMLSFFSNNNKENRNKPRAAPVADIREDMEMAEDDLVDIDAEFESLLTKTFEKESRSVSGGERPDSNCDCRVISP